MRRVLTGLAICSVIALSRPSMVEAQAASGQVTTLTLDEAIQVALGNNPSVLGARNSLRLNPYNTRNTWANSLLPSASLNLLNTSAGGNAVTSATDNFGNPISNPVTDWVYNSSSSQSLNFSWNFTGTSLFREHRSMEIDNQNREIALETQTNTVSRQVQQQFYGLQQDQFELQLQEAVLDELRRDLATTEIRYALAQGSQVDVRRAQLAISQQEEGIAQARRALEQSRLQLRTTLGDPDLGDIEIVPSPIRVFEPSGLDVEALILMAQTSSPQARSSINGLESQRIAVTNTRQSAWMPNFSASFRFGRSVRGRGDMTEELFVLSDYGGERDMSFSLGVRLPILSNYFQTKYNLVQAEVNLQNQEAQFEQTQLNFEQSVRSAYQNLVGQYEALRLAVISRDIAADALRLAREEYQLGASTFDQLQQIVDADESARDAVINAQYNFINNFIALENAIGLPVPVDPSAYERAVQELGDLADARLGGGGGN